MKKVLQGVPFFVVHQWRQTSQQGKQKYRTPEFLILSAIKLPSSELVLFIDIKITSFKSFLEESHAIALESCYIFTKKC